MKKNKNLQRKKRQRHTKGVVRTATPQIKLKVKKGDMVMVVSGKDKGKTGEIIRVLAAKNRVVIDGVAMVKKSVKKSGSGQSGRIVERPASIHASNVMVMDPETKKPTRVGREKGKDGKNVRITKKSKSTLK